MINRIEIKANSRQQIKGKIGILFVINLIVAGLSYLCGLIPIGGAIVSAVFLSPALTASLVMIYFKVTEGEDFKVGDIFEGFYHFWGMFKILFITGLYTFLWSLLFIVPGIIKSFSYSMAPYIWAENKDIGALEAIERSRKMMDGHKMDLFVFNLSFLGWIFLGCITFGLAFIYTEPYIQTATVNFYKAIKPEVKAPEAVCESTPAIESPVTEAPVEEEKTEE